MTDNKKGLAAANDQAPIHDAKHKINVIRFAVFLIAFQEGAIIIAVAGFTVGPMLVRLWGGA